MPSEEQEVERRAADAVENHRPALALAYRAKFGSEISTDNAREIVSPEYAASRENRTRFSGATQKPAGALADYLYDEALRDPDPAKRPLVTMTAGGTGAGKTTALASDPELQDSQFVYDSNLGSKKSSVQKIEAARAAGHQVHVIFVYRDPIEALTGGVLPRAMSEGRVVGLDAHARMHRDAAENFRYLIRKYSGDPNVAFTAIDNSRFGERARPMALEKMVEIRYSTRDLHPKLRGALEKEYAAGRIAEPVYRATLGSSPPEASGGVSRNPGSGIPQASGTISSAEGLRGHDDGVPGGESDPQCAESKQSADPS